MGILLFITQKLPIKKAILFVPTPLPARNVHSVEIFCVAFALATGPVPNEGQGGLAPLIDMLGFSILHTCSFEDSGFSA